MIAPSDRNRPFHVVPSPVRPKPPGATRRRNGSGIAFAVSSAISGTSRSPISGRLPNEKTRSSSAAPASGFQPDGGSVPLTVTETGIPRERLFSARTAAASVSACAGAGSRWRWRPGDLAPGARLGERGADSPGPALREGLALRARELRRRAGLPQDRHDDGRRERSRRRRKRRHAAVPRERRRGDVEPPDPHRVELLLDRQGNERRGLREEEPVALHRARGFAAGRAFPAARRREKRRARQQPRTRPAAPPAVLSR